MSKSNSIAARLASIEKKLRVVDEAKAEKRAKAEERRKEREKEAAAAIRVFHRQVGKALKEHCPDGCVLLTEKEGGHEDDQRTAVIRAWWSRGDPRLVEAEALFQAWSRWGASHADITVRRYYEYPWGRTAAEQRKAELVESAYEFVAYGRPRASPVRLMPCPHCCGCGLTVAEPPWVESAPS